MMNVLSCDLNGKHILYSIRNFLQNIIFEGFLIPELLFQSSFLLIFSMFSHKCSFANPLMEELVE